MTDKSDPILIILPDFLSVSFEKLLSFLVPVNPTSMESSQSFFLLISFGCGLSEALLINTLIKIFSFLIHF